MAQKLIEVHDLKKYYNGGDVKALDGVTADVYKGDVIAVIGPSGGGKSTFLRSLNLLETPTSGEVCYHGKNVAGRGINAPAYRAHVGMVFQSFNLFPQYTALKNVTLARELLAQEQPDFKQNKKQILEEIQADGRELLAKMGLSERANHYPSQLSGGQQQRVALARAVVIEPSVLLFDEPLSNLDAKLRNQMRAEIIKLRQRINTTFIYVTHDQTEAMTLGDRIVIMKDGVIQQIGTPQEVFDHPANLFVAGFIGMPQMNFYDAELTQENGSYAVTLDGAKVILSGEKQANLKKNNVKPGPITLGVRPEHLLLSGSEDNAIRGTVDVSEMMGSAVHLHVSACGRDTIMIVPTTEIESSAAFTIGSPIAFTFSGSTAHLFDRETQKNLEG